MGKHSKKSSFNAGNFLPAMAGGAAIATIGTVVWVFPYDSPVPVSLPSIDKTETLDLQPLLLPLTSATATSLSPTPDSTTTSTAPERATQTPSRTTTQKDSPPPRVEPAQLPMTTSPTRSQIQQPQTQPQTQRTTTQKTETPKRTQGKRTTTQPTKPLTSATSPTQEQRQQLNPENSSGTPVGQRVSSTGKCTGLNVEPHVQRACELILANVPGITVVGGFAQRPNNPTSCHPKRLALDLMTYSDRELGDRIYRYIIANKAKLRATTILWRVPNHFDHVHVSFDPCFK